MTDIDKVKASRDGVNPQRPAHMPQVRELQRSTTINRLRGVIAASTDYKAVAAAREALADLRPKVNQ